MPYIFPSGGAWKGGEEFSYHFHEIIYHVQVGDYLKIVQLFSSLMVYVAPYFTLSYSIHVVLILYICMPYRHVAFRMVLIWWVHLRVIW